MPSSARTSLPGDLIGSQTTRSGIAVTRTGRVTEPIAPLTVSRSPSATPSRRGGLRADPGHRRAGGAGELGLVALQRADVEQLPPGGEHRLVLAGADGAGRRDVESRPLGGTAGRPQRGELGPGRLGGGQAQVDVHLVGEALQHAAVGQLPGAVQGGVEGPHPALPVEVAAGLLGGRGHRQDDVGPLGDRGREHLQADHEAGRGQRRLGERRVGQVGGVDPADQQARTAARRGPR